MTKIICLFKYKFQEAVTNMLNTVEFCFNVQENKQQESTAQILRHIAAPNNVKLASCPLK